MKTADIQVTMLRPREEIFREMNMDRIRACIHKFNTSNCPEVRTEAILEIRAMRDAIEKKLGGRRE